MHDEEDEENDDLVLNLDSECAIPSRRVEELMTSVQSDHSDLSGQSTLLDESIEVSTEGTEVV